MAVHEAIHVLMLGRDGTGKSTVVGHTWPVPMNVIMFDPVDKARPYLERGIAGPIQIGKYGKFRNVYSKKDKTRVLIRINFFSDSNPRHITGFPNFLAYMSELEQELAQGLWATVVLDSVTSFEASVRKHDQYIANASAKDGRQWYAHSTEACEELLLMRFPNMIGINTVVIGHVELTRDDLAGTMVTTILVPGKLAGKVGTAYGEVYQAFTATDDKGVLNYMLQTRTHDGKHCSSLIGAPDPCISDYKALWLNGDLQTLETMPVEPVIDAETAAAQEADRVAVAALADKVAA